LTVDDGKEKPTPAKKPAKKSNKPSADVDVSEPPPSKKPRKSAKKDIASEPTDPVPAEAEEPIAADEEETNPTKTKGRPKKPVAEGENRFKRTLIQ